MKLHLILNTTAKNGGATSVWNHIKVMLVREHIDYEVHPTTYPGAARDIAKELSALADERVYLLVIGGDGTLNEVLNGITDFDRIYLGLIPAGSGNDFARGVGLAFGEQGFNNILSDMKRIEAGEDIKKMDLGEAYFDGQSRRFGISAGVGLDAIVCKRALTSRLKKVLNRLHLGQLTYVLLTVLTLFSMETAKAQIVLADGRQKQVSKLIFAAAMNLFAEGGGVPMAPSAHPWDGELSLSMAYGIPKALTFLKLPLLMAAKQEKIKGFGVYASPSFTLHIDRKVTLHTDGEYGGEVDEITFICLKEKLQLLGAKH